MTYDKNGRLIQAGDIVEIKGAYFKNDNGLWFVEQDGTNKAYCGTGLTLRKIGKTGKISEAKYNLAFWPLTTYVSDYKKIAAAHKHNKDKATIEINDSISNAQVIEYFRVEKQKHEEVLEDYRMHGYGEGWTEPHEKNIEYMTGILERLA